MTTLSSAARRCPALGRAALLALAFALLLGGWLLLAPPSVDAQNMNYYGRWYAKVGSTAICPAQNDVEAHAGTYSRTSANTITLNFRDWGMPNCGPDTAAQYHGWTSAWYRGKWYLELRTLPGSDGQLIPGAHIGLPAGFADRRTGGRLNRRDHTVDGHWPHSSDYYLGVLPVEISFSIPASHAGSAYLHAGIYFNEQDENWDVWEDFSFKFDSPEPPSAAPSGCAGPLQRTVNRLDDEYDSRDAQNRPVRYSMVHVTAIYDCNGELYTSRAQYGAPVNNLPAGISRPRTPHCSEIKTGVSWDYDRDDDGNLLATQDTWGPSYNFRVHWTGDDCDKPVQHPGSVGGGTYCGGGVLSQTPTVLERAIAADNTRIVYYVQLVQRLSGPDALCPFEVSNRFRTYDLPPTITAP